MYIIGDLESDHFVRLHCTTAVIRNINDQVLFVDKRKPVFEDMTEIDQSGTFPYLFINTEMTTHYSLSILLPTLSNISVFDSILKWKVTVVNVISLF